MAFTKARHPALDLFNVQQVNTVIFNNWSIADLEKAMAPHSSTLAWKIPWMEEPGRLQPMGSLGVRQTERLHFHFSLSCIGEGNGNPFQCYCLENPRDEGAWWAAVYGVAQSQTWLKRLSSIIADLQCCVSFGGIAKWFSVLFQILFHHRLSQDIEYSPLVHRAGPCCLSVLYIVACIC